MNKRNNLFKLIVVTSISILGAVVLVDKIYASDNCEENYGGGETCLVNKRFKLQKWVRLEGHKEDKSCDDWDNEITVDLNDEDDRDKYIEFCIKIKNLSDDRENLDFDDMKMKDSLPDELKRVGGDGLTEYFDDFEPGETKTYKVKVEIEDDEKDRHGEFEKCVVNKASVYWDGIFEGSDTATVCWKKYKKEITELPKTGSNEVIAVLAGLSGIVTGIFVKKKISSKKVNPKS